MRQRKHYRPSRTARLARTVAVLGAFVVAVASMGLAFADTLDVLQGDSSKDLGAISQGGSNSAVSSLSVSCSGQGHASPGELGFDAPIVTKNAGSAGAITEISVSTSLVIPATWPADNAGCGKPQHADATGSATITATVPSDAATGARSFQVKLSSSDGDVSNVVNIHVTYTVSGTVTPPPPVDTTAPDISYTVTPTPNGAGWNNSTPVLLDWSVTDADSTVVIDSGCADETFTAETGGETRSCSAHSDGGSAGPVSVTIKIDTTKPVISGTRDPAADADGWTNQDVDVTFSCSETGSVQSGIASDSVSGETQTVSAEGANQSVTSTGTCTDAAGNTAEPGVVRGINIDKTAPVITGSASPLPNSNGWNNTDVFVDFSCSDSGGSGIATDTVGDVTVSTEGANQTATSTGECIDNAGNAAAVATVMGINIDKTKPSITAAVDPEPNAAGWNNTDVTVNFSCSDPGGSGIATNTVLDASVTTEGADQPISSTGTCEDLAGNAADPAQVEVSIDKTVPTSDCADAPLGWQPDNVSIACTADDGLSGLDADTPGSFSLSTTVADGTDDSNASTGSQLLSDIAGNSVTAGPITGLKIDRKNPTVSITSPTATAYTLNAAVAADYSCDDGMGSGVAPANCVGTVADGANIDTSSVGSKTFEVTATDNVGHTGSASVAYSVQYAQTGTCLGSAGHSILQPINADGSSVFKKGSTVPAKFRVCDASGASIGDPGVVSSFKLVKKVTGTGSTSVNEPVTSTTPDTAFRWDPTDQQWIFNINTKNLQAGNTYFYEITLNDGSTISFSFGLK